MNEPPVELGPIDGTRPVVRGTRGVVASSHYLASTAALQIMNEGGNAFDAAVTAGFCLAILMPHLNGLGGECPALVRRGDDGTITSISGQGEAPAAATINAFRALGIELIPGDGWLPIAVPGTVGAYLEILARYGRLSVAEVTAPARRLAADGFPMYRTLAGAIRAHAARFRAEWPGSAALFLPDDRVPMPGDRWAAPEWAATVERLVAAEHDAGDRPRRERIAAARAAFYEGPIARQLVEFAREFPVRDSSGESRTAWIDTGDFARHRTRLEPPWEIVFRGIRVAKCGPWTQGPVLLQQLQMLEHDDLAALGHGTAAWYHRIIEVGKLAYADREFHYGDPNGDARAAEWILSPGRAATRRALVDDRAASRQFRPDGVDAFEARSVLDYPPAESTRAPESAYAPESTRAPAGEPTHDHDTVHIDVADADGNVASLTPSGGWLASSPVVTGVGFPLGTRAQMFLLQPGYPNSLAPGRRPRATLTPSIGVAPGRWAMGFGTPGGDGQDQWALQFFLRHVVHRLDLQRAVDEPTWLSRHTPSSFYPRTAIPAGVQFESRVPTGVRERLRDLGHDIRPVGPWAHGMMTAARWRPDGIVEAAASCRNETPYAVAW